MRMRNSGFTLMEMITVMAIASLITIASAPAFMNFTRTQRIRGAAGNIASALNSARRFAITLNEPRDVHLYTNDYDPDPDDIKNSFRFMGTEEAMERKLLHRTVRIESVSGGEEPESEVFKFEFTPRGTATQGGAITLMDTGDRSIDITILASTGRVRVGDLQEP